MSSVVVPILGLALVATLGQRRIGSGAVLLCFFPRPYGPRDADVQGRPLAAMESPRSVHRLPSASIAIAIHHQKKGRAKESRWLMVGDGGERKGWEHMSMACAVP